MPATNDPLLGSQWHIVNARAPSVTLKVSQVWPEYTGRGVRIGVVDDGIDYTHPDLAASYDRSRDYDALDRDDDAFPSRSYHNHGTIVAGVIAAQGNNGIGIAGVAYGATLIGYRKGRDAELTPQQLADILKRQVDVDVSNNSWTYDSRALFDGFRDSTLAAAGAALENAVAHGRHGLGTVFIVPAGNNRADGHNTNYHGFQNSPWTVTVAGIDWSGFVAPISTPGASILVSAAATGVLTTDRVGIAGYADGDYVSTVSGTSLAAPQVSGVVALMLEANPGLGFRDVQEILAYSARNPTASWTGWQVNGAANWNGGGLYVSHDYGFGLLDAYAAVRLAESWTTTRAYADLVRSGTAATPSAAIADHTALLSRIVVTSGIEIDRVLVDLDLEHSAIGDLTIGLTSPRGTTSILVDRPGRTTANPNGSGGDNLAFEFSSVQFLGETSVGTWTLTVRDQKTGDTGKLESWRLTFLGDAVAADDTYIYTSEWGRHAREPGRDLLIDSDGGVDTINFAAIPVDVGIFMTPGSTSSLLGQPFRLGAATLIENAIGGDGRNVFVGNDARNRLDGGRGNDNLQGGNGNDTLIGGPGADILDGGPGIDIADYGSATGAVFVRLWTNSGEWSDAAGDRLAGIEFLRGSRFGDALGGDSGTNLIEGGAGDDYLNGQAGNDILIGGLGADTMDGGDGLDLVTYAGASSAVFVRLLSGDGQWGEATGDRLLGIERVEGSRFDDAIGGSAGADTLQGGGGKDTINGHDGNDVIAGGAGADSLDGGAGVDVADYTASPAGVFVRLWAKDGKGGDAEGDRLVDFEHLIGSSHADALGGSAGANLLQGGGGADVLNGQQGADTLVGGAGADVFQFGPSSGLDVIADFSAEDIIDLSQRHGFTSFAQVRAAASQSGADTILDLGSGDLLRLTKMAVSSLAADDFHL